MKYWYKVKYGFKPMEFVSIEAGPDLERAIYAKIEKIPVTLCGKFIDGSTILRIEPHINKYTGWYDSYEPSTGDDEIQIRRDVPKEIEGILGNHFDFVATMLREGKTQLIGSGKAMSVALPERGEIKQLS